MIAEILQKIRKSLPEVWESTISSQILKPTDFCVERTETKLLIFWTMQSNYLGSDYVLLVFISLKTSSQEFANLHFVNDKKDQK